MQLVTGNGKKRARARAPSFFSADPAVLGSWRAIVPSEAMLHVADRVDADSPANEHEAELAVETINIDAASYRQLRQSCDGDPAAMAAAISDIVSRRGKMQNPATGSGGVLVGRLTSMGPARHERGEEAPIGDRVMPLASLVATPLRLDSVGPVDPDDPQVPVRGRAIVTGRMSWAVVPDDLPLSAVVTAIDVYPAASHTSSLARPGGHVVVLGSGHAGLSAIAAAREKVGPTGRVTVVDASELALEHARQVDPAVTTVLGDATQSVAVARSFAELDLPPGDLTLLCTTVQGCEGTAILLTSDEGTVLFFSTATSFAAAGLGADAVSSLATLSIPNGYTPDRGSYLLDLLRRTPPLLDSFTRRSR